MNDKPTCKTCGWASFPTPTYSKWSSQPRSMGMCKLWLSTHDHVWAAQGIGTTVCDTFITHETWCAYHLDADHATPEDLERVRKAQPPSYTWPESASIWDYGLKITDDLYLPTNNARHWQPVQRQHIACKDCVFERDGMCGLTLDNPTARGALQPEDHVCPGGCVHGQLKQCELGHPNNHPPHMWWDCDDFTMTPAQAWLLVYCQDRANGEMLTLDMLMQRAGFKFDEGAVREVFEQRPFDGTIDDLISAWPTMSYVIQAQKRAQKAGRDNEPSTTKPRRAARRARKT